jgi:hypothetical protein
MLSPSTVNGDAPAPPMAVSLPVAGSILNAETVLEEVLLTT